MAINFLSDQTIDGELTLSALSAIGSDTDKFLMSDSGIIKYVTGVNLRTYIGAGTSSTDDYVTAVAFDTSSGVLTLTRSGSLGSLSQDLDGRYLELGGGTITGNLVLNGTFSDSDGDAGTTGQVLSSTGTGTNWIDDVGTNIANSNLTTDATDRSLTLFSSISRFAIFRAGGTELLALFYPDIVAFNSNNVYITSPTGETSAPILSLREAHSNGNHEIGLRAPNSLVASKTYTLPSTDPTTGQVLSSSAGGVMSWVANGGGGNTNIANTNLTLDADRTLDVDGNTLSLDANSGTISITDSAGAPASYLSAEQGELTLMGIKFPSSDGTSGQYIKTNGSNVLSFDDPDNIANSDLTLSGFRNLYLGLNGGTAYTLYLRDNSVSQTVLAAYTPSKSVFYYPLEVRTSGNVEVAKFNSTGNELWGASLSLRPTSTTLAPQLKLQCGTTTRFVSIQSPNTLAASTSYTLPTQYGSPGYVLSVPAAASTTQEMEWVAQGGGPVSIMSGGGRIQMTTSRDSNARFMIMGGSIGFSFYNWSTEMQAAAPSFTGNGVPGTSTNAGTPYNANNGTFKNHKDGIPKLTGTIEFPTSTTGRCYFYVFKLSNTLVAAMGSGTYLSSATYTLVASGSVTIPSSNPNLAPKIITTSNGVSIQARDYLVCAFAFDGTVSSTKYFILNINLIVE